MSISSCKITAETLVRDEGVSLLGEMFNILIDDYF